MGNVGINFAPTFWGFMAAITEFAGGILLLLGLFFRPVCFSLIILMLIAMLSHINQGQSFSDYSHALEMAILFFSLLFIGPGRYSFDAWLFQHQKPQHETAQILPERP
jgi:putative oxidoreductase